MQLARSGCRCHHELGLLALGLWAFATGGTAQVSTRTVTSTIQQPDVRNVVRHLQRVAAVVRPCVAHRTPWVEVSP